MSRMDNTMNHNLIVTLMVTGLLFGIAITTVSAAASAPIITPPVTGLAGDRMVPDLVQAGLSPAVAPVRPFPVQGSLNPGSPVVGSPVGRIPVPVHGSQIVSGTAVHPVTDAPVSVQGDVSADAVTRPEILDRFNFGGTGGDNEPVICEVSDGGYFLAGRLAYNLPGTGYHGGDDFLVGKTRSSSDWTTALGGSRDEYPYSAIESGTGHFMICGETWSSENGDVSGTHHGLGDYWIVNLTSAGAVNWEKNYGGSSYDRPKSIKQTSDGGFIVAGTTQSTDGDVTGSGHHGGIDIWVIKLSPTGEIEWKKCYGGSNDEDLGEIEVLPDGTYVFAGSSDSSDGDLTGSGYHDGWDFWVVWIDEDGDITWQRCYGGTDDESAKSIDQATGGEFIVAGMTGSNSGDVSGNNGSYDYWVIRVASSDGALNAQKCLGGNGYEDAKSIIQTSDEGFLVGGSTDSEEDDGDLIDSNKHTSQNPDDPNFDYWVVKLDRSLGVEWQRCYGGSGDDYATQVIQAGDLGFVICGESPSDDGDITDNQGSTDFWVVKLTPPAVPTISGITPSSGFNAAPLPVVINGNNFRDGACVNLTRDGTNLTGTVTSLLSNQIRASFPLTHVMPGTFNLTVRNADTTSVLKENAFTVKAAGATPVLARITPASGYNSVNWPVTLAGSNFRSGAKVYLTQSSVTKQATITQQLSNQLRCTLPTKALAPGTWTVKVINTDLTSAVRSFPVKKAGTMPKITKVTPVKAVNTKNTAMTITGSGFRAGATVQIKKGALIRKATGVKITAGKITCTLPTKAAPVGVWAVMVTNADGTSATKAKALTIGRKLASVAAANETTGGAVYSPVVRIPESGSGSLPTPRSAGLVPVNGQVIIPKTPGITGA